MAEGYKVKFSPIVQPEDADGTSYFMSELGLLLNEVDASLFPSVVPIEGRQGVIYYMYENGVERLCKSTSLKHKRIPAHCIQQLANAIEILHSWAEDPSVPADRRKLFQNFRLPDPRLNPEVYRLTWSVFPKKRKLHVLWGLKVNDNSLLPQSKVSEKWPDANRRKKIQDVCKRSILHQLFSFKVIVFVGILVGILYTLVYLLRDFPIHCTRHPEVLVGDGIFNYIRAEQICTHKCVTCGEHLDENLCCSEHSCKRCYKTKPIRKNQYGICDDCFLN